MSIPVDGNLMWMTASGLACSGVGSWKVTENNPSITINNVGTPSGTVERMPGLLQTSVSFDGQVVSAAMPTILAIKPGNYITAEFFTDVSNLTRKWSGSWYVESFDWSASRSTDGNPSPVTFSGNLVNNGVITRPTS